MKRFLWLVLTAVMLIPVPLILLSHDSASKTEVSGSLLFGIESLDSILASASGKPVLINFWATWCSPCVRELPLIDELAGIMGDSAVFIAVDIGDPELSTLMHFRENYSTEITVVWLTSEEVRVITDRYELADVLPLTVILNGEGDETARAAGARSTEWFASALDGAAESGALQPDAETYVHIYIVGSPTDENLASLVIEAEAISGAGGYDVLDPNLPEDSLLMANAFLPVSGFPYAQLCIGGACYPPAVLQANLEPHTKAVDSCLLPFCIAPAFQAW
jgi:thiol-disulfide isomerase/thioredoxin